MVDVKKAFWMLRALTYKPFFGQLGWLSYVGKPVSILGRRKIFIDRNVHIYPGARLEVYGDGEIVIEENVSISENVHIVAGAGRLIIKSGTLIGPNVYLSNTDHEYRDVDKRMMQQALTFRETYIGEDNYIGVNVALLPGTRTGKHVIIGANSTLNRSYPDRSVVAGSPAKVLKTYNKTNGEWEKPSHDI